jgi:large subunit ribosomal protein L22
LEAKATARFVRISSRKINYVIDLIRKKPLEEAIDILTLTPKAAAAPIRKVLESAVANATENFDMDEEDLFISSIYVNEGPTMKRFKPRARGRATRIRKRTSHITAIVSDGKDKEAEKDGSESKSQRVKNRNK